MYNNNIVLQYNFSSTGKCQKMDDKHLILSRLCFTLHGICLFFCPLSTSRKNYQSHLHENFATDVFLDKKELNKFWMSSATGSTNFSKYSSTMQDIGHFPTIWLISVEKYDQIFVNIML